MHQFNVRALPPNGHDVRHAAGHRFDRTARRVLIVAPPAPLSDGSVPAHPARVRPDGILELTAEQMEQVKADRHLQVWPAGAKDPQKIARLAELEAEAKQLRAELGE